MRTIVIANAWVALGLAPTLSMTPRMAGLVRLEGTDDIKPKTLSMPL